MLLEKMNNSAQCNKDWWDNYFLPNGGWEKNNGRNQTISFAKHFLKYAKFNKSEKFSLLDIGCALGDGLQIIHENYPNVVLYGFDFSKVAIERCKKEKNNIATFMVGEIEDISNCYDIIYLSNVLEHIEDYKKIVLSLLTKCTKLYIMVPYRELNEGKPLTPNDNKIHKHTFDKNSFNFLINKKISYNIFSCPGAWSWCFKDRIFQNIRNIGRILLGKKWQFNPRQILYCIKYNNK